jgi:hypothetical protein
MKYCPNNESLKTVDVRGKLQTSRMILDVTFKMCVVSAHYSRRLDLQLVMGKERNISHLNRSQGIQARTMKSSYLNEEFLSISSFSGGSKARLSMIAE